MDQGKTGRFIAEKRKEKGMTQKELARQLGIGDKAVSKWECGRGMPDNSIMLPLCDLLGIKVNELLLGEVVPEKNYHESSKDIILTLMEEKESLQKKNKKNLFSGILAVLFTAILIFLIIVPIQVWHSWIYFWDPLAFIMIPILVLLMLLVSGNVKAFFRSFGLIRRKDVTRSMLFTSLQAVKLAIVSSLLGGALFTLLDTIFILRTMAKEPERGVSVTLLTALYGILFALLLLPLKYRLESEMEEIDEKSDESGMV